MLVDANDSAAFINQVSKLYSKEERADVRNGENLSPAAVDKTIRHVLQIAGQLFHRHPDVKSTPKYSELGNTFIFRAALGTYLLVVDWAARGGAADAAPAKLRNDFVDMMFAAYATYFDGLFTSDAKVHRLHGELRLWLTALVGCELPGGLTGRGTSPWRQPAHQANAGSRIHSGAQAPDGVASD
jgi:hypothetical protein